MVCAQCIDNRGRPIRRVYTTPAFVEIWDVGDHRYASVTLHDRWDRMPRQVATVHSICHRKSCWVEISPFPRNRAPLNAGESRSAKPLEMNAAPISAIGIRWLAGVDPIKNIYIHALRCSSCY
ncbi:hypothetical protein P152DRAFT_9402 [Eremomyces bilateralis CBS 781.70]|uniref:Uncharacterized protein n=1 Tax=Eremomyces bilateralis CBS 781.70 TaxID=1392243 RepID=A0A6G1GH00_9PEZI|nr:uncharacterized protein P152DRAFT_9402 [Eremomyces bilateralis CBS 781.70]KAF1817140.1 hypothetical protein P152DRAFT_9402 [Eremomyces bilateralis CBS 781.70]